VIRLSQNSVNTFVCRTSTKEVNYIAIIEQLGNVVNIPLIDLSTNSMYNTFELELITNNLELGQFFITIKSLSGTILYNALGIVYDSSVTDKIRYQNDTKKTYYKA